MSESFIADLALAALAGLLLLAFLATSLYDSYMADRSKLKPYMIWMAILFCIFIPFALLTEASDDPRFYGFNVTFLIWMEIVVAFGIAFLVDQAYETRDQRREERRKKYSVKAIPRPEGFLSREALLRRSGQAKAALVTPVPRGHSSFRDGAITAEFEVIPLEELRRMAEADKEPLPPIPYVWSVACIRKRVRTAFTRERGPRGKLPSDLKLSLWRRFFRPGPVDVTARGPMPLGDDGHPLIIPLPMPWRLLQRGKRLRWHENAPKPVRDLADPVIVPRCFPFWIPGTVARTVRRSLRRLLRGSLIPS